MRFQLSITFRRKYNKQNIRIRKAIHKTLRVFYSNPHDTSLRNHPLKRELQDFRSINITADYRAIYKEVKEKNGSVIAFFDTFGTHEEIFR